MALKLKPLPPKDDVEGYVRERESRFFGLMARMDDRNACTVRALAHAFDMPYLAALHEMEKAGRQHGRGMKRTQYAPVVEKLLGWSAGEYEKRIVCYPKRGGNKVTTMTIGKWCGKGKWICSIKGHAFAVIDGVVSDSLVVRRRFTVLTAIKVGE